MSTNPAKRRLALKTLGGSALAGGLVDRLPGVWQRPLIQGAVLPAHAQVSPAGTPMSAGFELRVVNIPNPGELSGRTVNPRVQMVPYMVYHDAQGFATSVVFGENAGMLAAADAPRPGLLERIIPAAYAQTDETPEATTAAPPDAMEPSEPDPPAPTVLPFGERFDSDAIYPHGLSAYALRLSYVVPAVPGVPAQTQDLEFPIRVVRDTRYTPNTLEEVLDPDTGEMTTRLARQKVYIRFVPATMPVDENGRLVPFQPDGLRFAVYPQSGLQDAQGNEIPPLLEEDLMNWAATGTLPPVLATLPPGVTAAGTTTAEPTTIAATTIAATTIAATTATPTTTADPNIRWFSWRWQADSRYTVVGEFRVDTSGLNDAQRAGTEDIVQNQIPGPNEPTDPDNAINYHILKAYDYTTRLFEADLVSGELNGSNTGITSFHEFIFRLPPTGPITSFGFYNGELNLYVERMSSGDPVNYFSGLFFSNGNSTWWFYHDMDGSLDAQANSMTAPTISEGRAPADPSLPPPPTVPPTTLEPTTPTPTTPEPTTTDPLGPRQTIGWKELTMDVTEPDVGDWSSGVATNVNIEVIRTNPPGGGATPKIVIFTIANGPGIRSGNSSSGPGGHRSANNDADFRIDHGDPRADFSLETSGVTDTGKMLGIGNQPENEYAFAAGSRGFRFSAFRDPASADTGDETVTLTLIEDGDEYIVDPNRNVMTVTIKNNE